MSLCPVRIARCVRLSAARAAPLRIARVVQRPVANGRAGDRGSHIRRAIWRERAKAAHQRHVAAAAKRCAPFRTLPVHSAWGTPRARAAVVRLFNGSASVYGHPPLNAGWPSCRDSPERSRMQRTHTRVTHSPRCVSVPHLHRDWAHPCHICTGTGLTPATSAPGLRSPLPHLRQDCAHPCHICARTALTPATSAPGLGPGSGRRPTRHKSGRRSPAAPSQHTAVSGETRSL